MDVTVEWSRALVTVIVDNSEDMDDFEDSILPHTSRSVIPVLTK